MLAQQVCENGFLFANVPRVCLSQACLGKLIVHHQMIHTSLKDVIHTETQQRSESFCRFMLQMREHNVTVNAIAPGATKSGRWLEYR
jgi:hypothetical protein